MTIFQEAARLADEFPEINMANYDIDEVAAINNWGIEVYHALRTIAALDASVEPVAVAGELPGTAGGFTQAAFNSSHVPLGTKLYTQQQLKSAVLKAHDAAIEKAADVADEVAQRNAGDGNKADYRASILALKGNDGWPSAMAQYATNGWTNTAILTSRVKP